MAEITNSISSKISEDVGSMSSQIEYEEMFARFPPLPLFIKEEIIKRI
jgi:hypothetical protein